MDRLLGIDIGTSACKAALFEPSGRVCAQAQVAYAVDRPQPGWAQQHPDQWWQAAVEAIRQLLQTPGVAAKDIAGIGVDGQSWAAVLVDGQDQPLCPTPLWMDTRAASICEALRSTMDAQALFDLCGNPLQPSYTLPKLLWYRAHWPEVYAKATGVLQCNGYAVLRLTGRRTQDVSQGYGFQCFDMRAAAWDEASVRAFGIPRQWLPEPMPCHAVAGYVTAEAGRLTGLIPGTPVVAGGLDAACGTLGAGVLAPGQTQEQGGQAGGMSICLDEYRADPRLILSRHVVPDRFLLQGGTVGGGGALRWFAEQFCQAEAGQGSVFERMSEEAGRIAPGSDGLIFLPYLAGERSPLWDPQARGMFYGIQFHHTRPHFIRAVMEGVAYSLRHNLEVAAEAGARAQTLHAMGGAANSLVWTQIKSDVTGCPIAVPASDTATTLGASILAGVGVGVYEDFDQAVRQTLCMQRLHEPNQAHRAAYDAGYEQYRSLYERTKEGSL